MANSVYKTIQVERVGAAGTIVLNQPPLNIIDYAMILEICAALKELEADAGIRVIVFRGAGPKGFSAGVSVQDHAPDRVAMVIPAFDDIFRLMAKSNCLTVASVHGFCFGGGFELAMMCDLVTASEDTKFAQPEIKLGQAAPIGLILLPPLIGYRKAAELLFTGRTIGAAEARALGLVNDVVPAADLAKATADLVGELSTQSGAIIRLTKHALRKLSPASFEARINEMESFFLKDVAATADAKEGIFAFLEKRAPNWVHA